MVTDNGGEDGGEQGKQGDDDEKIALHTDGVDAGFVKDKEYAEENKHVVTIHSVGVFAEFGNGFQSRNF